MTKQLSPASLAVLDAAKEAYWLWDQMCPAEAKDIAAAALRAAADCIGHATSAHALYAIADNLEGAND